MALARVQAKTSTSASVTFDTAPTVGNAVVVVALYDTGFATCADNHGHTYLFAHTNGTAIRVFYCPVLTATGAPFTITISGTGGVHVVALEVGGVGAGLAVDQSVGSNGAGVGSVSSGTTAALTTASDSFQVGAISTPSNPIYEDTATPAWTAEHNAGGWAATKTRVVSSATGTTPSASWTLNGANYYRVSIVAFKGATAPAPPSSITLVGSVAAHPGANGGSSPVLDTTGATLLVVTASWYSGGTTALTVSDSHSNTWIPLTLRNAGTVAHRLYYALAPTVGITHTVSVAASGIYPAFTVYAFAGTHITAPFASENGTTTTSAGPRATGSVTPPEDEALIVSGWAGLNATAEPIVDSGLIQTMGQNPLPSVCVAGGAGYKMQATAAAINPTWSWTGVDPVALAVAVFLPAAPPPGAPGLVVTIDGVAQRILHDSLSIQATVNGRDRLSCTLPLPTVAPALLQTIVATEDGERIYGGLIDTVRERAAASKTDVPSQLYDVTATDYNALPDWRHQNIPRPAETLKAYLAYLVPWLYGVTLAPDQVDGPLLPARTPAFKTITAVLDELSTTTGYVWNINYAGVLKMWEPGFEAAPFDILDSNDYAIGEITVERAATGRANVVWLFLGDSASRDVTETLIADGTTIVKLTFPTLNHANTLTHDGVEESVGPGGVWEVERQPGTYEIAAAFQLRKSLGGAPAAGAVIVFTYLTQYPLVFQAVDAAGMAEVGFPIETVVSEPTVLDHTQGPALAAGHLDRVSAPRREIRYRTRARGLVPGQVQTITIANRGLSGSFFITDVETRMQDPLLVREVTAQQATGYQGSWRDVYRLWAAIGGSLTAGTTATAAMVVAAPTPPE